MLGFSPVSSHHRLNIFHWMLRLLRLIVQGRNNCLFVVVMSLNVSEFDSIAQSFWLYFCFHPLICNYPITSINLVLCMLIIIKCVCEGYYDKREPSLTTLARRNSKGWLKWLPLWIPTATIGKLQGANMLAPLRGSEWAKSYLGRMTLLSFMTWLSSQS